MQNFSSLSSTQMDFFDLFSRKIQDFLKENSEFSQSEKSFEKRFLKGIFYKILSHLAFFENFQL
jgi:hypothetical protein